jgi:hypothetical protein
MRLVCLSNSGHDMLRDYALDYGIILRLVQDRVNCVDMSHCLSIVAHNRAARSCSTKSGIDAGASFE